mgnify:CR=1 FL=1
MIDGHAEVRAIFSLSRRERVAGADVTEGRMVRGASIRVLRDGQVVHESIVSSLRRFKEGAREVATGYECGVGVRGFTDFEVGDVLEVFRTEEAG